MDNKSKKLKILCWDIEVAPIEGTFWNLWQNGIPHSNIIQDWFILCGAWKELGSDKVEAVYIKHPEDDYEVVKKLRDVLASADIVVHHNGDKFDIKKLNARLIYHKLDPIPLISTVDTLKEVKKIASFTSNRLDYLGQFLFGEGKQDVNYQLWQRAYKGNKTALREMVQYNKQDVLVLERLYLYLRPYMKSHPHVGAIKGEERFESCPKCGSTSYKKNGFRFQASGIKKQECQCKKCHSYFKVPYKE